MSDTGRNWPTEPEFTGLEEGQQLYDIYNSYWTELGGSEFPDSVSIPVHGVITEEAEAIFGHHFDRMAQTEREWKVAGRLFCVAMSRLRSDVPITEIGETVIALPRTDFSAIQNETA